MPDLKLVPVSGSNICCKLLYDLLKERAPEQSISHMEMPSLDQHWDFVRNHPYAAWYEVRLDDFIVGAIYLTKQKEIGISIFRDYQHKGYGARAVRMLMEMHKGPFLANINPANEASAHMFRKIGFGLIQHTYRLGITGAQP